MWCKSTVYFTLWMIFSSLSASGAKQKCVGKHECCEDNHNSRCELNTTLLTCHSRETTGRTNNINHGSIPFKCQWSSMNRKRKINTAIVYVSHYCYAFPAVTSQKVYKKLQDMLCFFKVFLSTVVTYTHIYIYMCTAVDDMLLSVVLDHMSTLNVSLTTLFEYSAGKSWQQP